MRLFTVTVRTLLALAWVALVYAAHYWAFLNNLAQHQPALQALLGRMRGGGG